MRHSAHEGTALHDGWPSVYSQAQTDPVVYLAYLRDGEGKAKSIARHLAARQFDVRYCDQRSRVNEHDVTVDLQQAGVVVALVTTGASRSKMMAHLFSVAEDLGKPIIPVIVEDTKVPLALSGLRALDMRLSTEHGIPKLLQSIRVLSGASRTRSRHPGC